jgi:predicted DNA-binding protein
MLSVRLPEDLAQQLDAVCEQQHLTKSKLVQTALRRYLEEIQNDPFLAWIGQGKGEWSTDALMRLSRGDDWNQP